MAARGYRAGSRRARRSLLGLGYVPVALPGPRSAAHRWRRLGGWRRVPRRSSQRWRAVIGASGSWASPPSRGDGSWSSVSSGLPRVRPHARRSARTNGRDGAWSPGRQSGRQWLRDGLDQPAGVGEPAEPFVDSGAALAGGLHHVRDGLSSLRAPVERLVAHFKNWKIFRAGYRRLTGLTLTRSTPSEGLSSSQSHKV